MITRILPAAARMILSFAGPGRIARPIALGAMAVLCTNPVDATEFSAADGELNGSVDITLSAGATMRASDRDDAIIGVQNGGEANSVNGDNGNLNYDSGDLTSTTGKVLYEAEFRYNWLSGFSRGFYLYDNTIMNGDTKRTELTERAEDELGNDFTLLDAYLAADVPIGNSYLTLRGGNMVLSWGESTFIQNGINSINPLDVSKLRAAGAELRDGLTAIPLIDASFDLNNRISLEGFYQFAWDHTEVEPEGTFFSTNDFASPGGEFLLLGFGQMGIPDIQTDPTFGLAGAPTGVVVHREHDHDASDDGQYGAALRWFEPNLNDTEFGFYFTRLHSRLPLISAVTGTEIGLANGNYAETARFFREFPEDIDTYGFSFNTEIPQTGTAFQGEVSFRQDQPLQMDDVEVLFAALSPLNARAVAGPHAGELIFEQNQVGDFGFSEYIAGWRQKDVIQAQATMTHAFGPRLGADQFIALGEFGATMVQDMEDQAELRYEASGTYTSGNEFFSEAISSTGSAIQPATTREEGFADATSMGYRLILRGDYNGAFGPVNLQPQLAWSQDISGTSPTPISNFIEGRKTITTSLAASYLISWNFKLSYTNSFGGDEFNLLNDRDFVSFTASYSY